MVLEAARAATLATHSAAGLAQASQLRSAARLLRAAEGLCRAAAAHLRVEPPAVPSAGAAPLADQRKRRSRGRGGRKQVDKPKDVQCSEQMDGVMMVVEGVEEKREHVEDSLGSRWLEVDRGCGVPASASSGSSLVPQAGGPPCADRGEATPKSLSKAMALDAKGKGSGKGKQVFEIGARVSAVRGQHKGYSGIAYSVGEARDGFVAFETLEGIEIQAKKRDLVALTDGNGVPFLGMDVL